MTSFFNTGQRNNTAAANSAVIFQDLDDISQGDSKALRPPFVGKRPLPFGPLELSLMPSAISVRTILQQTSQVIWSFNLCHFIFRLSMSSGPDHIILCHWCTTMSCMASCCFILCLTKSNFEQAKKRMQSDFSFSNIPVTGEESSSWLLNWCATADGEVSECSKQGKWLLQKRVAYCRKLHELGKNGWLYNCVSYKPVSIASRWGLIGNCWEHSFSVLFFFRL